MKFGHVGVIVGGETPLLFGKMSARSAGEYIKDYDEKSATDTDKKRKVKSRDPVREAAEKVHYLNPADEETVYKRMKALNDGGGPKDGDDVTACFKGIRVGFPAGGFKKALMSVVRGTRIGVSEFGKNVWIIVKDNISNLVEVTFKAVKFRLDMGAVGAFHSPHAIYRLGFAGWEAKLPIKYNAEILTSEDLGRALVYAGTACGVGAGRPGAPKNKTWTFGTWTLADAASIVVGSGGDVPSLTATPWKRRKNTA
jgi:hypothetical protein